VLNLTCAGLERLFGEGCTLAILACNTASVVALRWIQQQWLPVRRREDGVPRNAIGIVVPTIEAATGLGWHEDAAAAERAKRSSTIAVFATRRTVETGCYPIEIRKRRPDITVVQQACPELAGSIEQGAPRGDLRALVEQYVGELRQTNRHHARLRDSRLHALPPGGRSLRCNPLVPRADHPPAGGRRLRAEVLPQPPP
jgi:glutamate racemase